MNSPFGKLNHVNVIIAGIPIGIPRVFAIAEAAEHPLKALCVAFIKEQGIGYKTVVSGRFSTRYLTREA